MEGGPGTIRIPSARTRPQDPPGQGRLTPQLETMLLWLTLTLLWSSTCWADETFGPGGGTYFMISKNNEDELTGIRVFIGPVGLIKSIQVRYGSSWSEKYGIPGGKSYELLLQPSEHITRIFGRYRKFIQCLTMYTSRGNKTSFGKEIGKGFFAAASQNRKVLIGVYGQYRLYGLTSIGFLWDYPRGGMTSAQH
nr:zymogen granule protein 16 homolog B-like [Camelus bactrianus]